MKTTILTVCLFFAGIATSFPQQYMTRTGRVYFNASTKTSPEKIEAKNNEAACLVDSKTGDLRFQIPIKSFKFERELMQEHFNENYMESDKFPKAEFKGSITNITGVPFDKDGTYNASVSGKLTIHGVTNDVTVQGTVSVKGADAKLIAKFSVKLKDYNITVPSVVADKIDKEAQISLDCDVVKK